MNFLDTVLEKIKQSKQKYLTTDQIMRLCGLNIGFDRRALDMAINELCRKDKLVRTARNKYTLSANAGALKGRVIGTGRGYVFVRPEDSEVDDIFVPEKETNGAIHDDLVLVKIDTPKGSRRNNFNSKAQSKSGKIIKIVERSLTTAVGIYSYSGGGNIVTPDDKRFCDVIFISPDKTMGALPNSKVVVKITDYPSSVTMARGEIIEVLGDAGDPKIATISLARSFGLSEKFPDQVLSEAKNVKTTITKKDLENRTDFRNQLVITIDGADAKDFDDAISLKMDKEDFILSVHIADVSNYVKEGSEIDKEAFRRGTSVYFPDLVIPMLPEVLSNNICSLRPDEDRLTLSVVMRVDVKGKVVDYKITKGVIKSCFRMTYDQVTKIFNGDKVEREKCKNVVPMLEDMRKLAKILINLRNKEGNLDFDLPEVQIDVDEKGRTTCVRRKPRNDSDKLIEQFMVLTNQVVAKHFDKLKLPFVYRVHESPTPEKLTAFADYASGLGLKFFADSETVRPKDFQKILFETANEPYHDALSKVMLRSMQKAVYYEKDLGHFGLALRNYCHFTSPIRRYPDLIIHRIISYYLAGTLTDQKITELEGKVSAASEQSSLTERNADDAERTVDDQKKAEFMANKIGEVFDASVSGVSETGIFVELENTVEGLIYREYLPADRYYYDEKRMSLIGKNNQFKIGDKVKVKLIQVDIITRHIDFTIYDEKELKNI